LPIPHAPRRRGPHDLVHILSSSSPSHFASFLPPPFPQATKQHTLKTAKCLAGHNGNDDDARRWHSFFAARPPPTRMSMQRQRGLSGPLRSVLWPRLARTIASQVSGAGGWVAGEGGVARFGRGGSVWEGCLGKCLSVCVSACLALCVHELALCVHIRLHVMRGPCTRRLEIRAFRPSAAVKAQVSCHVPSTTHLCCVLHLIPSLYAYASDKVASFTLQPSWYSLPYITVHPPSQPPPSLPPSPPPPHQ